MTADYKVWRQGQYKAQGYGELPTQREKKGRGYGTSQTEREERAKTERTLKRAACSSHGTVIGILLCVGRWGTEEDLVTGKRLVEGQSGS